MRRMKKMKGDILTEILVPIVLGVASSIIATMITLLTVDSEAKIKRKIKKCWKRGVSNIKVGYPSIIVYAKFKHIDDRVHKWTKCEEELIAIFETMEYPEASKMGISISNAKDDEIDKIYKDFWRVFGDNFIQESFYPNKSYAWKNENKPCSKESEDEVSEV